MPGAQLREVNDCSLHQQVELMGAVGQLHLGDLVASPVGPLREPSVCYFRVVADCTRNCIHDVAGEVGLVGWIAVVAWSDEPVGTSGRENAPFAVSLADFPRGRGVYEVYERVGDQHVLWPVSSVASRRGHECNE